MSRLNKLVIFLFLLLSFLTSQVWTHTPLSPTGEIHSLDTAFEVSNPTKSWDLYRRLHHEGEAEYYKLHLKVGDRLRINLYTNEIEGSFSPHLIIMTEDLPPADDFPGHIEQPEEFGAIIIKPSIPENPEYEPFTPTSYYYLIDIDEPISKEGEYYVVVYEPNSEEGEYGIAIGYKEEFTVFEWLLIPINAISIHEWEGQSLIVILAPLLLSLVFGLVLLLWKSFVKRNLFNIVGSTAGLLYVGSGLMILMQMILALGTAPINSTVVLTAVFIAVPLLLGFLLLKKIINFKEKLSTKDRFVFAGLGLVGFFTWSGLLLGPTLAILAGFLPNTVSKETPKE